MPRIQYPAMREMNWQRAPRSAEPNGWSVAHDARAWASARSHTQYKNDRPRYGNQLPSYSATPFYNSDEGPKAGVSKRAETSGARYSAMTVASSTRRPFFSASHGPAPGAYSPVIHDWGYNRLFVPQPGSPAFVDGQARVDPAQSAWPTPGGPQSPSSPRSRPTRRRGVRKAAVGSLAAASGSSDQRGPARTCPP